MLRCVNAFLMGLALASCAPVPTRTVPHVTATIHRAGVPLRQAKVEWLTSVAGQLHVVATATTNDVGSTEIPEQRRWRLQFLLGDRLAGWEFRVHEGDRARVLWHDRRLGSDPSDIVLLCDLAIQRPCVITASSDRRFQPSDQRLQTTDAR